MKTKKPYVLAGNFENMGDAFRILEKQNIAYILDERHVGKTLNNNIPVIGLKEAGKLSKSHIFVDIAPLRGGGVLFPIKKVKNSCNVA